MKPAEEEFSGFFEYNPLKLRKMFVKRIYLNDHNDDDFFFFLIF